MISEVLFTDPKPGPTDDHGASSVMEYHDFSKYTFDKLFLKSAENQFGRKITLLKKLSEQFPALGAANAALGFFSHPPRLDGDFGPENDDAGGSIERERAADNVVPCLAGWDVTVPPDRELRALERVRQHSRSRRVFLRVTNERVAHAMAVPNLWARTLLPSSVCDEQLCPEHQQRKSG
jgi:hypothetical protein